MKKILMFVLIMMVATFTMYGCNTALDRVTTDKVMAECDNLGDVRSVECVVIAEDNSTLTLKDTQGQLWQVDMQGYTVGNTMMAWIADNGTINDTTDDTILYTIRVTE